MSAQHTIDTDVLVVGAGPGGSATAYHLARHGIDVTIVERAAFPRDKVCGDGLTPRGVAAIVDMGIDTDDPGFEKVIGLRVYTRTSVLQLPWPELNLVPGLRPGDAEGPIRSPARAARRQGRGALDGTDRGGRPGHRRRVGAGRRGPPVRGPPGRHHHDPGAVRRRGGRRGWPVRPAGRRPPRRLAAVGDRRPPVLPDVVPPGTVVRVVARPVGRRDAAPRVRLALPGGRRADQPRRRAAQHVPAFRRGLRATALLGVRPDASRGVGLSRRRRPKAGCCRGRCR